MRILQISSARTLGGGERHFADLANGLARRGHEVYAALAPGSPLRDELRDLPADNVLTLSLRNALDLKSASGLARLARERRVELIHAHVARDYTLAAFAARRARGARFVVTRHVLFPLGHAHRIVLARAARVIAVSEAVARTLRARGVFPEHKIRVVQNGIDIERLERAASKLDCGTYRRELGVRAPQMVGSVGELSEVKGQADLVRAAVAVLREMGNAVEFVIVGEDASRGGGNRAKLEASISELGVGGHVRLAGRRGDVAEFMSCLDVFVNTSRSESFGLATVEAMACGAAVVATATDGSRELIEDGVTGLLTPVGDAGALAAAVLRLLRDESLRASLGDRARRLARERWSVERMIDETERVYLEALSQDA
ncbi:MAG TPA: glycosyltransferase [Pyrinomonadaceae bacterium]